MKLTKAVNKHRIQRIVYIFMGSILLSLFSQLIFYSLFLLFPSLFIKAGLIAKCPLVIVSIFSLLIPAGCLIYKIPISGDRFLTSIISAPYSSIDLKSALELEINRSYPGKYSRRDSNFTAFLANQFSEKILNYIVPECKALKRLFPGIKRVILSILIIVISLILSIVKIDLVTDVYTALRTGLPAELIALDSPIKFEKLEAVVIPPAYIDADSTKVTNLVIKNKIKVMQGSSVLLRGALKSIQSGKLILSTEKGVEYFTVSINKNRFFEATFLAPMKGAFALEFSFSKKQNGKISGKSKVFMIEALPDQPPSIKIFSPPEEHNIVFGNPFGISFAAADDYGILEIKLYHRNPESGGEYHKELVARFPKEPKTNYSTTYVWNPVLREGKKFDELVYHPGTKKVEYFIEVKDINIFSTGGIARSEIRYVYFTDIFTGFKEGTDLIHELIRHGKQLLQSPGNREMINEYRTMLKKAVNIFSKELKEIMPRSSLVQKTNRMRNVLSTYKSAIIEEPLKDYIAYLERFIVFLKLMLETESSGSINSELSKNNEMNHRGMDSALKRIAPIAEMLEKEFKKELEEIKKLIEKGDITTAQARMKELLEKIRKRMSEGLEKTKGMAKKIADEIKEKLEKLTKASEELLIKQEINKAITDKGKMKTAIKKQEEINDGLLGLDRQTEKLTSEYPFIMGSLSSYARSARIYGGKALMTLKKSQQDKSSNYQKQVIAYLKGFQNSSSNQMKMLEELSRGNFERLMSGGSSNRFVFIPKEAVYTIPIDYKSRIIEMSKERSKNTKEKEAFWRDILE